MQKTLVNDDCFGKSKSRSRRNFILQSRWHSRLKECVCDFVIWMTFAWSSSWLTVLKYAIIHPEQRKLFGPSFNPADKKAPSADSVKPRNHHVIYSFPAENRNEQKWSKLQLVASQTLVESGKRQQKQLKATVRNSIYQIWHRSRIRHEPRMIPKTFSFEFSRNSWLCHFYDKLKCLVKFFEPGQTPEVGNLARNLNRG